MALLFTLNFESKNIKWGSNKSNIGAYKRGAAAEGRRPPFIGAAAGGRRSYIGVLLSQMMSLNFEIESIK